MTTITKNLRRFALILMVTLGTSIGAFAMSSAGCCPGDCCGHACCKQAHK